MIQIENISVNKRYSISLHFDKNYTKENLIFGEEEAKQSFFRKKESEVYEKENFKRNFGTLIEEGLAFAESDNLRTVRHAADGLAEVLKQGRGTEQIEPYKVELFRIYNGSENITERYVILKIWHKFSVRHREINKITNTMRRKQWEQIGAEYEQFANRMLMPFEKKFTTVDDIQNSNGNIRLEMLTTDKGVECIYTFDEDILPLYMLYLTELSRQGKHIRTCEVCGRKFVASRKDTRVCGAKCKSQRQAGYFKEHKAKVKEDTVEKAYQQNRDGYDNFLKKLNRLNAPEDVIEMYRKAKYDFLGKGREKRKAYRNGKMKKSEILEWIRADRGKRFEMERDISERV